MSKRSRPAVSRRGAVAGLLTTAICGSVVGEATFGRAMAGGEGPSFSPSGPRAAYYGADSYPIRDRLELFTPGNPQSAKYRVGAFSHFDELFPTRCIPRPMTPWAFKRESSDLSYTFRNETRSIADYLSRNPVTGLLIARDDKILVECYQYGRTDRHRLLSQSMVKSITGLLIGIAMAEDAIRSVDDLAETYVPELKGTEYGKTPIRALLHMSSGVDFGEDRDNGRDLDRLWIDMVRGGWLRNKGTVASIAQFNHRIAQAGTRFHYASIEPDVLGAVLRSAVGASLSNYLHENVWSAIGAEADATWLIDAPGFEVAHHGFSAVVRDYARLGRLLAHDGAWEGRQIVPQQWMIDATTVRASEKYLEPGRAAGDFGYGYLLWLLPWEKRQFALLGLHGQRICIDPVSKIVMVHTAVEESAEVWALWNAAVAQFGKS